MGRKYLHSLEGIRAYAFLCVFVIHYSDSVRPLSRGAGVPRFLWSLMAQISWTAVPIFFVLSGFLITGVLFDTRELKGFFRTFYARRALRILPLYYLVLASVGLFGVVRGLDLSWRYVLYFLYLHNFVWEWSGMYHVGRFVDLGHLWSLAIEEQFYLVWPVVIFFVRSRRRLLGCCYGVILLVTVIRVLWPLTHLTYLFAYECSLTRCDALMIGAALALHRRGPMQSLQPLLVPAKVVGTAGLVFMLLRAVWVGQAFPFDQFGLAVLTPVVNLVAAAAIVLAIEPATMLARVCSRPWAVRMGSMSYSLYVVHQLLMPWFRTVLLQQIIRRLHAGRTSLVLMMAAGFAFTYAIAWLSYHFVEMPALEWKNRFRYGPAPVRTRSLRPILVDRPEALDVVAAAPPSLVRSAS